MSKKNQKSFYIERIWQPTDATGYSPYAMRYSWSFAGDPAWEKHLADLQIWETERKQSKNSSNKGQKDDFNFDWKD